MSKQIIADKIKGNNSIFEIIEWHDIQGAVDSRGLEGLAIQRNAGIPIRQLKITLPHVNAGVNFEAGALQAYWGNIEISNKIKAAGALGRFIGASLSGETFFRPTYTGVGTILTEPGFQNILLIHLDNMEVVADQGAFLACETSVEVGAQIQRNISSALFGGEGLVQTRLKGSGMIALNSVAPIEEIMQITLKEGESMAVDGPFVLLRSASVKFTVGKSAKTWMGTAFSGEGLLQKFTGPGDIWLSPLQPIYNDFVNINTQTNASSTRKT